jgi:hypothetical protein
MSSTTTDHGVDHGTDQHADHRLAALGIDLESPAFAVRLGLLLTACRERSGVRRGVLASASHGMFTSRELRQFEHGIGRVDGTTAGALALLYGADLGEILPERLPLVVRRDQGAGGEIVTLSTCGVAVASDGDLDHVLEAYLGLVKRLRGASSTPVAELRRADIESLSRHAGVTPDEIIDRLGSLMGATHGQRRAMRGMFAAGALVIGLVGAAPGNVAAWSPVGAHPAQRAATIAPPNVADPSGDRITSAVSDAVRAARMAADTARYGPSMGDEVRRTLADAAFGNRAPASTPRPAPTAPPTTVPPDAGATQLPIDEQTAPPPHVGDTDPGDGVAIDVAVGLPPVPPAA